MQGRPSLKADAEVRHVDHIYIYIWTSAYRLMGILGKGRFARPFQWGGLVLPREGWDMLGSRIAKDGAFSYFSASNYKG